MSSCGDSKNSFVARVRSLFGRRFRAVAMVALLLMSGMPIRPEEIEEQMRSMGKAGITQLLESEQQPAGETPEEGDVH